MKVWKLLIAPVWLLMFIVGYQRADAQENLAQQAYAIFEQNCLNCHGEHGAFTEEIIIERTALIEIGAVVPREPGASELYQRLIEKRLERRMPLGQPPLTPAAIDTIRRWILADAPNWADTTESDSPFITPKEMLETIEKHVNSLAPFDRGFARYFTMTHLYNAGETAEALHAYQRALSKLVNSLSWGRNVINPRPIDPEETIFYIDLRDYEWEIGTNRWTQIEAEYPYEIDFNVPTQTALREKLTNLREALNCEVPSVHVDWFLATASLPPLYHDILDLPQTDRELETRLEVNVVENLRNAAGKRVWRAGFNDSGVSNNNRVVERHDSRYGAYWKSYDFAGSVGTQNIFTHPLSFTHDGGEIVFNLPNGLQAYYLADAGGRRLNAAPIDIVSNPAASDPTVRNGLSCIGCHTEGMKTFEDQVRGVVEQNPNPPFNKDRALRLYAEKSVMDARVEEDTQRYREALEAAGGIFGGIEPIQRFHEAFHAPLDIAYAAATVGLETRAFLARVRQNTSLQNLGLLVLENGTIKRDTWTSKFSDIMFALDFPEKSVATPVDPQTERIPGASVHIPDLNLRAAIAEKLGKTQRVPITVEDMENLRHLNLFTSDIKGIKDLRGLEFAVNLVDLLIKDSEISDLSPLAGLKNLSFIHIEGGNIRDLSPVKRLTNLWALKIGHNSISDLSPIAGLHGLENLGFYGNSVSDLSPIAGLKNLTSIAISHNEISDLSPLKELPNLKALTSWSNPLSDLSPLIGLEVIDICGGNPDISTLRDAKNLKELYLRFCNVSDTDISALAGLTSLTRLSVAENRDISDISALAGLTNLKWLNLRECQISDVSPLAGLTNLEWLNLEDNVISDFSPLEGLLGTTSIFNLLNPGSQTKPGPKIEGPWVWVIAPTQISAGDAAGSGIDFLSEMSGGEVTELKIATNGATNGAPVGNNVWTAHKISATGNNINDMANATGLGKGNIDHHVAYGSIHLSSPRHQDTHIFLGADNVGKVWLNGELVGTVHGTGRVGGYRNVFPVILKQGTNFLLVAVYEDEGDWRGFFGFEEGTEYSVSVNPRVGSTFSKSGIHVGDTFTLDLSVANIHDLAGWQFDIAFDSAVLEAVEVKEGDFLKREGATTFFQKGVINNRSGKITGLSSARLSETGVTGIGTLVSVTFIAKTDGQTQLRLENFQLAAITGVSIPADPHQVVITVEGQLATGDVNRDGQVSILDMVLVARHFGETVPANSEVDINGDGLINILDLILVSQHMGGSTAAAPSILAVDGIAGLDPVMIQAWIERAQLEDDGSIAFQHGIAKLQSLLASMIPEETALLANYPNPFNPETWIPYQLSESADVALRIYAVNGSLVRTLALGQMPAGVYQSRSRAAYWDGRNDVGEPVASGVYFYTLTVDDFTATRKMLIRK